MQKAGCQLFSPAKSPDLIEARRCLKQREGRARHGQWLPGVRPKDGNGLPGRCDELPL